MKFESKIYTSENFCALIKTESSKELLMEFKLWISTTWLIFDQRFGENKIPFDFVYSMYKFEINNQDKEIWVNTTK